jgi:hypothetical protein
MQWCEPSWKSSRQHQSPSPCSSWSSEGEPSLHRQFALSSQATRVIQVRAGRRSGGERATSIEVRMGYDSWEAVRTYSFEEKIYLRPFISSTNHRSDNPNPNNLAHAPAKVDISRKITS